MLSLLHFWLQAYVPADANTMKTALVLAMASPAVVRADLLAPAFGDANITTSCQIGAASYSTSACQWIGERCSSCPHSCILSNNASFVASANLALARDMSCVTLSSLIRETSTGIASCPTPTEVDAKADIVAAYRLRAGAAQLQGVPTLLIALIRTRCADSSVRVLPDTVVHTSHDVDHQTSPVHSAAHPLKHGSSPS